MCQDSREDLQHLPGGRKIWAGGEIYCVGSGGSGNSVLSDVICISASLPAAGRPFVGEERLAGSARCARGAVSSPWPAGEGGTPRDGGTAPRRSLPRVMSRAVGRRGRVRVGVRTGPPMQPRAGWGSRPDRASQQPGASPGPGSPVSGEQGVTMPVPGASAGAPNSLLPW